MSSQSSASFPVVSGNKRPYSGASTSDVTKELETKKRKIDTEPQDDGPTKNRKPKKRPRKKKKRVVIHLNSSQDVKNSPETDNAALTTQPTVKEMDLTIEQAPETPEAVREISCLKNILTQSLTCQICLEILHIPHSLSPCGHVACQDCLIRWFTAPPPAGTQLPEGRPLPKKCPQCRAQVKERPIEVWTIKNLLTSLISNGTLTPPPSMTPLPAPDDPWAEIFPPRRPAAEEETGQFDAEDQVYRCIDCLHEIWGGACSRCGRLYDAQPAQPRPNLLHQLFQRRSESPWLHHLHEEDEEEMVSSDDNDEEESALSDFIVSDDDVSEGTNPLDVLHIQEDVGSDGSEAEERPRPTRRVLRIDDSDSEPEYLDTPFQYEIDSDSSNDEDKLAPDGSEAEERPRPTRRVSRIDDSDSEPLDTPFLYEIDSDSSDDEDRLARTEVVQEDSESSDDSEVEVIEESVSHVSDSEDLGEGGQSMRDAITAESSSDSDSDGSPPPSRKFRRRKRR